MKGKPWQAVMAVACVFVLIFVPNYAQYQLSPIAFRIIPEFGMDAVQFSALFSAAMITGIVLSPIAGILCDKFGTKRMIGIAATLTMVALIVRVFVHDYAPFFFCMLCAGVTATFVNSNVSKIMGSWFTGQRIGVAVGIGVAGSVFAMVVGMSTTILFPSTQVVFVFTAVLAVLAVALWWLGFREKPAEEAESGETVEREMGSQAPAAPPLLECIKTAVRSRNIWILGLGLAMNMAATMAIMTFMPQALVAVRGFDEVGAGAITSIVTVGSFVGSIAVPVIVTRFNDSRPLLAMFSVVASMGTAFAWLLPEGMLMTLGLFLTGFCTSGVMSALVSLPVRLPEIGPVFAGTAGGVAASMQLAGAVVIPTFILTPLFGDNFTMFYLVAGALCAIMAACCMLLPRCGDSEDAAARSLD